MSFFVKDLPNICSQIGPNHFYKILGHIQCIIEKMVGCQKLLIHLWWKRQISTDSVASGSNLNYSCLIVCSLFFPKIISRYISIYLIRESPKVFQDSTPSYERSCPSFWPHFETGIRFSKKSKKFKTFALCHYLWPSFQENNKLGLRKMS
jgi:hypothetical protein